MWSRPRQLLAAPYRIRGMVTHGAGRGAKIGFPTANLGAIDTLLPAQGVYAGRAWVGTSSWPAAINLGPSPTFGDASSRVSKSISSAQSEPLYGQPLEVDFLARLRDIRPFDSPHALVEQLARDVEARRSGFRRTTPSVNPASRRLRLSLSPSTRVTTQPHGLSYMSIDWRPFVKLVSEAQSFVLTSHMRPDCDAIGSELGLALALRSLGKTVRIVNGDAVPPHIAFIDPNARRATCLAATCTAADVACDVLIVLDTSAWSQLGPMADVVRSSAARKVVIDHHVSEDDLGADDVQGHRRRNRPAGWCCRRSTRSAWRSRRRWRSPLFAAIATDTGWFRFASVTRGDFRSRGPARGSRAPSRTPSSPRCTSRTAWRGCCCRVAF